MQRRLCASCDPRRYCRRKGRYALTEDLVRRLARRRQSCHGAPACIHIDDQETLGTQATGARSDRNHEKVLLSRHLVGDLAEESPAAWTSAAIPNGRPRSSPSMDGCQ
jgi:hypothetical protein